MLPAAHRLTRSESFRTVIREGRRAGSRTLVVHLVAEGPAGVRDGSGPRAGFVVSKAVGNSVVRHRVQRRLRHLVREHLGQVPSGSELVVRANPAAATASSRELGTDLARCLQRLAVPSARAGASAQEGRP